MAIAVPAAALAQTPPPSGDVPAPLPPPSDPPLPDSPPTEDPDPMIPPAEPPIADPTYSMQSRNYHTTLTEPESMFARFGWAVSAGGGVSGFTNQTARDATQAGGGWDVRATFGTRSPLAAEVSYLGSAQTIEALGLDDNAVLLGNGVQANVRVNLSTMSSVQPFFFAGAAWRRYQLTRVDTNTSDVADDDDVLEIPLGAGVAYRYNGFILDARGEYRRTTQENLMPSLTQDGDFSTDSQAELHRWGVNANIGYEF
ncbi:MAG: porin family protein [Myxococcota bacterium]|nr:porin family protein [Myxococcota bacterium]